MKRHFLYFAACLTVFSLCCPFSAMAADYGEDSGEDSFGGENSGLEESFKKERRIFLWDVTISMVGATRDGANPEGQKRRNPDFEYSRSGFPYYNQSKDIFDRTREDLLKMIMQIQSESTEVIVLPFRNEIVGEFRANATEAGKRQLRDQIMGWNDLMPGGTFTATCLRRAVGFFTPDRVNRLILLTDGEPSGNEGDQLLSFIRNWDGNKETRGEGNYLVYVMLTDEANGNIGERIIEESERNDDISVITPDTPISEHSFVSIARNASIHVRDYFDGKSAKNGRGVLEVSYSHVDGPEIDEDAVFHFSVEDNDYVSVDSTLAVRPSDGKLLVPFTLKKSFDENLSELPHDHNMMIEMTCSKDPACRNLDIAGKKTVFVSLVIKPEPRLEIRWSAK